jgi:hypothetical protein
VPRPIPRVADPADPERYAKALASEDEIQLAMRRGYNVSTEVAHTKKKVGSFADNLTAAVKAEYETLKKNQRILN